MPHRKNHTKRNPIDRLHRTYKRKSRHYASWDKHPYSYHIHWLALLALSLGVLQIANQPWSNSPQSSYSAHSVLTRPQSLFAANNIWTQTDWSGGNDGGNGLNLENQMQWNMYRVADPAMAPGMTLTLAPIKDVVTHDANLSSGTRRNVTDTSGSITLDIDETKKDAKGNKDENKGKNEDKDKQDKKKQNKLSDTYVQTGELTSAVIALEQQSDFTTISWNATLPQDTNIRFQLASNNDQMTWNFIGPDGTNATYYTTAENESIYAGHDGDRYIKYKAFLTTINTSVTPALSSITIGFQFYPSSATLTSSVFNTTDPTNKIAKLSWTEDLPSETNINVQVRTAPDQNGAPGTFTPLLSYSDPTGGEQLNPQLTDGTNDQWIQYLVTLSTTDPSKTPSLADLSIQYEPSPAPIAVEENSSVVVEEKIAPSPDQAVEPVEASPDVQPVIPIEEGVSTSLESEIQPSNNTTQTNVENTSPTDPSPPITEQPTQEEPAPVAIEQSVEANQTLSTVITETPSVTTSTPPPQTATSTHAGGSFRVEQPTSERVIETETVLIRPETTNVTENNIQTIESNLTQTIPTDIQLLNNTSAPLTDALQSFLVTIRKREMLPLEKTKITLSRDKALLTISSATTAPNDESQHIRETSSQLDRLLIDRLWEKFVPALTSPFASFLGNAQVIIFAGDQNERSKEGGANDTGNISSDITLYFEIPNATDPARVAVGFYNKEAQMWEPMEQEVTISGDILSVTIHKLGVYSLLTKE